MPSNNEYLADVSYGTAGYEIFYVEATGNQTYERLTDFDDLGKSFDIYNTGVSALTLQINDDGVVYTVEADKALGTIAKQHDITKIVVTTTGSFKLLIRK